MDRIERDVLIAAPVERVWALITESDHIAKWFGESADVDLRVGGKVVIGWQEHGTYECVIERLEPPRLFAYRGAIRPGEPPAPGNSTVVEFTLAAEGAGTRLRVVESGFTSLDLPADEQRKQYEGNIDGWREELAELVAYAERSSP